MNPPILSVIVVCKNPGKSLETSLASVWAQREAAPELVVIDGASRDGTREWLAARRDQLGVFHSEPDSGIYDAMNKGIARARGDWVLFLGADDSFAADIVVRDAAPLLATTEADVLVGEAAYDDGRVYRLPSPLRPAARNFLHHQATFYRRELFARHGPFDPSLAIMADYEFNLRLWKQPVRFAALPLRVATCGAGGLSDAGGWRGYREEIRVRHRHFPFATCLPWDAVSVVRFLRKKIVRARSQRHG